VKRYHHSSVAGFSAAQHHEKDGQLMLWQGTEKSKL